MNILSQVKMYQFFPTKYKRDDKPCFIENFPRLQADFAELGIDPYAANDPQQVLDEMTDRNPELNDFISALSLDIVK